MAKQKAPYQVRMDEDLYTQALAKAKSMGISFAAYVRILISKDLSDKG